MSFLDSDGREWIAELTGASMSGAFNHWEVRFFSPNRGEYFGKVYYPDLAQVPEEDLRKALEEALSQEER
jgi:hypothetical protein